MIKVEEYKDGRIHYWKIKYNELELLRFTKSEEDEYKWIWFSEEMHTEDDDVTADTFDEAVELLKEKIKNFYYEKLMKYESIIQEIDVSER